MSVDTARDVVVHGEVQGVFFRQSCRAEAESRGVTGWVTNEYDGTVRAHFEGPADAVEAMVAWARSGPAQARVERVEVVESGAEGRSWFEVR
ncbi:MAG TPA: acylphosphatase [Nocardioidaceae bacterium]|nr:acylphosphatase [Nocardioidaceae bacterium]